MVQSIVVLTGAGISAESGIATFRASDGVWQSHRIEDVATPEAFAKDPSKVHNFYNARRQQLLLPEIQPNAAHRALARLESEFAGEFLLVTQNIDDLHERGGSQRVLHMHGELLKKRCVYCESVSEVRTDLGPEDSCDHCARSGGLRPHVVWFGELPFQLDRIASALQQCDLFVSIGTSGHVYPAAGFVEIANSAGAETIELNLEPSATQSAFRSSQTGPATKLVPDFVSKILGAQDKS